MNNFQKYSRPGVYIICHLPSGRKYVGQAANMYSRWTVHRHHLKKGTHHCTYLQRAWNKYPEQEFEFRAIQFGTVDNLDELETKWYNRFRGSLFNIKPPGKCGRGYTMSLESRLKLSRSAKLISNTDEQRKMRSERTKRMHAEGRITYRPVVCPVRVCKKCGKQFNRYKKANDSYHQGFNCLTCMAAQFANSGGRFDIESFQVTQEEFDDAAYELTCVRLYKPEGV